MIISVCLLILSSPIVLNPPNSQATPVSGPISSDTTWNIAGSPYVVMGDVTVLPGVTLTIDPGVEVKFNGFYTLFIDGTLIAMGSETNRINFTSNWASPAPGNWDRIEVSNSAQIEIDYSNISYGTTGIYLDPSHYNNITNNNIFLNDGRGIFLYGVGNYLANNDVYSNGGTGIDIRGIETNITNNEVHSNGGRGILIMDVRNNLTNNNIYSNDGHGINLRGRWSKVTNNTITNNLQGITLDTMANHNNTITFNNIHANTEKGIKLWWSPDNNISNNNISNNGNVGIDLGRSSRCKMMNNTVTSNGWGIEVADRSYDNIIADNNVSYNLWHGLVVNVASRNVIAHNYVSSNFLTGIIIDSSSNNSIVRNTVWNNSNGIEIIGAVAESSNNTITNNTVMENQVGFDLWIMGSNNRIYHNNIIDNIIDQARDSMINDSWDDGYPSGGNYWSDWSPICADNYDGAITPQAGLGGPDGICDLQYDIDADSIDYYPLTNYAIIKVPTVPQPPYITNLRVIGTEVNVTWDLSPSDSVNAYDVYGGSTQTSIDFSAPIYSTPDEGAPAEQWWAQFSFDIAGNPEYYFVLRARNNALLKRSSTSNTAGYFSMDFDAGLNTFSLPLKSFSSPTLDTLMTDIGASSISILDTLDDWQTYTSGPSPNVEMGVGYVVDLPLMMTSWLQ
jgi:parallel beta-helix repeat protein